MNYCTSVTIESTNCWVHLHTQRPYKSDDSFKSANITIYYFRGHKDLNIHSSTQRKSYYCRDRKYSKLHVHVYSLA